MVVPLCRCRVLYIGSAVPTVTKDGLQGIQEPLKERYPVDDTAETKGIDSWLSVWSNGLLLEYIEGEKKSETAFFPVTSLHYCAAVRYVNVKGYSVAGGGEQFLPIDSPFANLPDSPHPPIFAAIFRRTTGVKVLECHAFICANAKAANALVRCCFHAYGDSMMYMQMNGNQKIPGLKAIKEKQKEGESSGSTTPRSELEQENGYDSEKDIIRYSDRAIGKQTWQKRQQSGDYDTASISSSLAGRYKKKENKGVAMTARGYNSELGGTKGALVPYVNGGQADPRSAPFRRAGSDIDLRGEFVGGPPPPHMMGGGPYPPPFFGPSAPMFMGPNGPMPMGPNGPMPMGPSGPMPMGPGGPIGPGGPMGPGGMMGPGGQMMMPPHGFPHDPMMRGPGPPPPHMMGPRGMPPPGMFGPPPPGMFGPGGPPPPPQFGGPQFGGPPMFMGPNGPVFPGRPHSPDQQDGPIITGPESVYGTMTRSHRGAFEEPIYMHGNAPQMMPPDASYHPAGYEQQQYDGYYDGYRTASRTRRQGSPKAGKHRKPGSVTSSRRGAYDNESSNQYWDNYESGIYRKPYLNEKAFINSVQADSTTHRSPRTGRTSATNGSVPREPPTTVIENRTIIEREIVRPVTPPADYDDDSSADMVVNGSGAHTAQLEKRMNGVHVSSTNQQQQHATRVVHDDRRVGAARSRDHQSLTTSVH